MSKKMSVIAMPRTNANDDSAVLVRWMKPAAASVQEGECIALIETTKAVVEVESDATGFLQPLVAAGTMVPVGDPIAWILDTFDPASMNELKTTPPALDESRTISKKARELLRTAGISAADMPGNGPVRESEVRRFLEERSRPQAEEPSIGDLVITDRSVVLFGAADQGTVVLDCLRAAGDVTAVCFVDEIPRASWLEGVPVFDSRRLEALVARGIRLAHVCIGAPRPKLEVAKRLKTQGLTIISAIHPRAMISPSATLGEGIYVGPGVIVGPHAVIGDYSQVNNNATVPHHVKLGVGVRISDGAHVAGGVTIGDRSYLGLGVTVNTDCHIGADVTIVSGASVFDAVPDGTIFRAKRG